MTTLKPASLETPQRTNGGPADHRHRVVGIIAVLIAVAGLIRWTVRGGSNALDDTADRTLGTVVEINRAEAATLQLLPAIGPQLAGRIVEERRARGEFRNHDDLQRVSGIGEIVARRLEPYVSFDPGAPGERGGAGEP